MEIEILNAIFYIFGYFTYTYHKIHIIICHSLHKKYLFENYYFYRMKIQILNVIFIIFFHFT